MLTHMSKETEVVRRPRLWLSMLLLPVVLAVASFALWGANPWTVLVLATSATCGFLVWSHGDFVANFAYAGGIGALLILSVSGATGYHFDADYRDFWGGLLRMTATAAVSGGSASMLILLFQKARELLAPKPSTMTLETIPNSARRLRSLFSEVEQAARRERISIEAALAQAQEIVQQQAHQVGRLSEQAEQLQRQADDAKRIAGMSESERQTFVRLLDRNRRQDQAIAFVIGVIASLIANALWNAPRLLRP